MKAIAIDIGGSHATVALVEGKGILNSREVPADSSRGLALLLPTLKNIVAGLLLTLHLRPEDCAGLAMCICAMVDKKSARVVATNEKFDDATGIDLPAWCETEFGIPFALDNDARMALLGEWYAGAAQGAEDVVMITLGTGIGGAVFANGKPFCTRQVQGGCWGGHIPVLFTGRRCTCGAYGCMEAEASGWALPLIARDWPNFETSRLAAAETINFRQLFEFAREGDRIAAEIRDRCLHVWACGTVGLIHAYGPERILFGGGVTGSADEILPYIREYVNKYAWSPSGPVQILPAALGNDAALLGAIPLLTGMG
jgi:glucokinase